ncbi:MAG: cytochrome-c peroxidase [Saprospiraceae bacterium]
MKTTTYFSLLVIFLALSSCVPDQVEVRKQYYYDDELAAMRQVLDLPEEPLDYSFVLPSHLSQASFVSTDVNDDVATLGRVLFYDKALSATGQVSCASCHHQELAFSDNKALSQGVNGNTTVRNSLALGAVASFGAFYGDSPSSFNGGSTAFMWDNRFVDAQTQTREAIMNEKWAIICQVTKQ